MLLMIDNYDSFTYNLVQYLSELGEEVKVARNDEIALDDVGQLRPERIVISPGPCTPAQAGISVPLIERFAGEIPILGVCLGHQSIGQAFGGRIVMISSVSGLVGSAPEVQDTVAYSAAKAGLNGLTRDLAVKWARHGIHVNAVAPAYFPTRMTAALIEQNEAQMRALSPLGRLGREGELKGVVVFLCSRAASYVTGQILAVDGGRSLRL